MKRWKAPQQSRPKYNANISEDEQFRKQFSVDFQNRFKAVENPEDADVEEYWKGVKNVMTAASDIVFGHKKV